MSLTLTEDELYELTHYRRPAEQLRALEAMRIPHTHRKHDNTVCVLRIYATTPGALPAAANDGPQLKSSRK